MRSSLDSRSCSTLPCLGEGPCQASQLGGRVANQLGSHQACARHVWDPLHARPQPRQQRPAPPQLPPPALAWPPGLQGCPALPELRCAQCCTEMAELARQEVHAQAALVLDHGALGSHTLT